MLFGELQCSRGKVFLPQIQGKGEETPKELFVNIGGIHRREDWCIFPLGMSCRPLNLLKQSCATWSKEKRFEERRCVRELPGGQMLGWACRFSVPELGVMMGPAYVSTCKICLCYKDETEASSWWDCWHEGSKNTERCGKHNCAWGLLDGQAASHRGPWLPSVGLTIHSHRARRKQQLQLLKKKPILLPILVRRDLWLSLFLLLSSGHWMSLLLKGRMWVKTGCLHIHHLFSKLMEKQVLCNNEGGEMMDCVESEIRAFRMNRKRHYSL